MIQVKLSYKYEDTQQETVMTVWVDRDHIKRGDEVLLKNDPRWWRVREVYNRTIQKVVDHKSWKVGGLT